MKTTSNPHWNGNEILLMSAYCYRNWSTYMSQSMMMIGGSCRKQVEQTYRGGGSAANQNYKFNEWDFPNNCSLSLPFIRCIPEINTKAVILSLLICLFFLLFINLLKIAGVYQHYCWQTTPSDILMNRVTRTTSASDCSDRKNYRTVRSAALAWWRTTAEDCRLIERHTHGNRRTPSELFSGAKSKNDWHLRKL